MNEMSDSDSLNDGFLAVFDRLADRSEKLLAFSLRTKDTVSCNYTCSTLKIRKFEMCEFLNMLAVGRFAYMFLKQQVHTFHGCVLIIYHGKILVLCAPDRCC